MKPSEGLLKNEGGDRRMAPARNIVPTAQRGLNKKSNGKIVLRKYFY